MNPTHPVSAQRRTPGWFLVSASVAGIALVLFQMSKESLPTLRPDPSPPVVEPTPTLWTPRASSPGIQTAAAPAVPAAPAAPAAPTAPAASKAPAAPTAPLETARAPFPTDQVRTAVKDWAEAWRSRNVERYMRFYAEEFANREAFARQKQRVIGRAQFIELDISELRLTPLGDGQTEVRFLQSYRSDSFENITLKRQLWREGPQGQLQILEESS